MVPLGGVMLRALANVSGGTLGEGIECGLHKGVCSAVSVM